MSAADNLSAARATRLPRVVYEGGNTALDEAPAIVFSIPVLPLTADLKNFWAFRTMGIVPIFTSGRISRGIDAAESAADAARNDAAGVEIDIKIDVATAYVTVLMAQRGVEVTEKAVSSLSAHAEDVENLFDKGLVARNDLLSPRVALADVRQRLLQAQNGLDVARASYNRLLGRPLTGSVTLDEIKPEQVKSPRRPSCSRHRRGPSAHAA